MDVDHARREIIFLRNNVELMEEWVKQSHQIIHELQERIFDWQDEQIEILKEKLTAK